MKRTLFPGALFLASLVVSLSGCSAKTGPKITGKVTLDGKPLSGAQVTFEPKATSLVSGGRAITADDGTFEIKPDKLTKQTLKPGEYVVLITKFVDKTGKVPSEEDLLQLEASKSARNLVPSKYSVREQPLLEVTVKEGDQDLPVFALKRQ
jgi:hypothetical protein